MWNGRNLQWWQQNNTYDWFAGMPLAFGQKEFDIVEVSFKEGAHKDYFWNEKGADYCKGDKIAVETPTGFDVGEVSLKGELVRLQLKKKKIDEKTKFLKSCASLRKAI